MAVACGGLSRSMLNKHNTGHALGLGTNKPKSGTRCLQFVLFLSEVGKHGL